MKRSNRLLRRYIREAIDLGKIQFAPNRVDSETEEARRKAFPPDGQEPNTPEEEELYQELLLRVTKGKHFSDETAKTILALLDSKYGSKGSGFFSEPPPNEPLYRGQVFDTSWMEQHIPPYELDSVLHDKRVTSSRGQIERLLSNQIYTDSLVELKTPHKFTDRRGWSRDPLVAVKFAASYLMFGDEYHSPAGTSSFLDVGYESPSKGNVGVVLVTTPASSGTRFLDLSSNIYKTSNTTLTSNSLSELSKERECVNLGPVSVERVAIVTTSEQS